MLDLSDVPLENDEARELIAAADLSPAAATSTVRELVRAGVIQVIGASGVKLHDAFRLLARDSRAMVPAAVVDTAREALVVLLQRSLPTGWTVGRFSLWVRLLPQTGRHTTLIDVATQEDFHQLGEPSEIRAALEAAAHSAELGAKDRFWALDALAFWDYTYGRYDQVSGLVSQMADVANAGLGAREAAGLAVKQMIAAALRGDRGGVEAAYTSGLERVQHRAPLHRIVRYNHALSLFQLEANDEAASEALQLVEDYYDHLGLELDDVFGATAAQIRAAVPNTPDRDDDSDTQGIVCNSWPPPSDVVAPLPHRSRWPICTR